MPLSSQACSLAPGPVGPRNRRLPPRAPLPPPLPAVGRRPSHAATPPSPSLSPAPTGPSTLVVEAAGRTTRRERVQGRHKRIRNKVRGGNGDTMGSAADGEEGPSRGIARGRRRGRRRRPAGLSLPPPLCPARTAASPPLPTPPDSPPSGCWRPGAPPPGRLPVEQPHLRPGERGRERERRKKKRGGGAWSGGARTRAACRSRLLPRPALPPGHRRQGRQHPGRRVHPVARHSGEAGRRQRRQQGAGGGREKEEEEGARASRLQRRQRRPTPLAAPTPPLTNPFSSFLLTGSGGAGGQADRGAVQGLQDRKGRL